MATPPGSPPRPPPADPSASSSTVKRTRKATWLWSLATRPPGAERPVVHIDPAAGKADGPQKKKLRTYLGIVSRDKVDVTYRPGRKSLLLRRIWYGRIFRYVSFLLWFSLICKIYTLLTHIPNFLFVRRNFKSLKLLTVGQRRKFFRLLARGGGSLNRTWPGNGPLQPIRMVWMKLSVKNIALTRINRPSFVRHAKTLLGRYVLCHFSCFPQMIHFAETLLGRYVLCHFSCFPQMMHLL